MLKQLIKAFSISAFMLLLSNLIVVPANLAAATDPTVVIALDNTAAANCVIKRTQGTNTTTSMCSIGTIMISKDVLLSEAVKAKENYLNIPPKPWTSQVAAKFNKDLSALMDTKKAAARAKAGLVKSNAIRPNNTICGNWNTLDVYWDAWQSHQESILYYYVPSDCSYVKLDHLTEISGSVNGFDHMQYSSASWDPGCPNIGDYYPTGYVYTFPASTAIQPIGLYFEPYVAISSWCATSQKARVDIGPVN